MRIAVLKERRPGEMRVAASPDTVKRFGGLGFEVVVETGAGAGASWPDEAFREAGAAIADDAAAALAGADIVLKVQRPILGGPGGDGPDELGPMKRGAVLVGLLAPYDAPESLPRYATAGVDAFAMELMPRITRAQTMDVLSSQSNLAGYKAVLDAAQEFARAFPMMMTAAGTVPPARVCVMGAGVAGLQAIATARRLGAVVSAFDVRAAAKEQVQSLGATFIEVEGAENLETAGGYAREASADFQRRQRDKIAETLRRTDIVICTALIPGRPAPTLITEEMVEGMKPGSVIVDLAVERGGNCTLSEPGEVVVRHGVTIVGHLNVPGRIAADASMLYAKNLLNFLSPLVEGKSGTLRIDWNDEIVKATALTHDGAVVNTAFGAPKPSAAPPVAAASAVPASSPAAPPAGVPQALPAASAGQASGSGSTPPAQAAPRAPSAATAAGRPTAPPAAARLPAAAEPHPPVTSTEGAGQGALADEADDDRPPTVPGSVVGAAAEVTGAADEPHPAAGNGPGGNGPRGNGPNENGPGGGAARPELDRTAADRTAADRTAADRAGAGRTGAGGPAPHDPGV